MASNRRRMQKAAPGGKITPIPIDAQMRLQPGGTNQSRIPSLDGQVASWFGPSQPLPPMAPDGVGGRRWDYAFGQNLQYIPRSTEAIGFADLRGLADSLPVLRAVIETRKDQIASLPWMIRPIPELDVPKRKQVITGQQKSSIQDLRQFLKRPDKILPFDTWLRALLEDMLVVDAATIYPRPTLGGGVYSLDVIDGSSIKPLIDESGRRPMPPNPAFQQILKGVVAADFTNDELMYLPRNVRSNKLYGFSPVEQIVLTINTALRRDVMTLEYYRSGTVPDSFGTLPKEWTQENIKQFQDYYDSLMQGNTQARRGMRFMPSDFKYQEARQPPLKDLYDEWLARVICYVFSVPPTPFVAQTNRATAETQRVQSSQEGLVPMQQWVKHFLDHIIQDLLGMPDLEFAWSDGDTIDPMVQMQVITGYVAAGLKSRDEGRDEIGEGPIPDGSGAEYTITGGTLSPARLPTPEEQQQQHDQQMALTAAKKPAPGEGNPGEGSHGEGATGEGVHGEGATGDAAQKLAKDFEEDLHPRDQKGRFAPKGESSSGSSSADPRPRDAQGRFIYHTGGGSRKGPQTSAGQRRKLLDGVRGSLERAAVGAALIGGSILATSVFAPEAGSAALAISLARAVGIAAVGEAGTSAISSVLDYLKVPKEVSETVQAIANTALGAYLLATFPGAGKKPSANDDTVYGSDGTSRQGAIGGPKTQNASEGPKTQNASEGPIRGGAPSAKPAIEGPVRSGPDPKADTRPSASGTIHGQDATTPQLALPRPSTIYAEGNPPPKQITHQKAAPNGTTFDEAIDGVKAALYETAQDVIADLKARAAAASKKGDGAKLGAVNDTLEEVLEHFLDCVDTMGSNDPTPDRGNAKEHPVADVSDHPAVAQKLAKADEGTALAAGIAETPVDKMFKAAGWKTLEPVWQSPAAEQKSTSRYRKILLKAFAKAAPKAAAFVRDKLGKMLAGELAKADDLDGLDLSDISATADDLADVSEDVASDIAEQAIVRVGVEDKSGDIVNRVSARAVEQARARAAELVGMTWDDDSQTYVENPNPDMAITDSTRTMLRTIIADGLQDNLSADDIADQIETSAAFSADRASLIAMTEIARANSDAAVTAYQEAQSAGVKVKKRWIVAAQDVCDVCTANAKQGPIDLDEDFESGDAAPPAHPVCRCAVAPVVATDDSSETDESMEG